jgi:hypothetical protein
MKLIYSTQVLAPRALANRAKALGPRLIFSAIYNISQPNFAKLLILVYALSSCGDLFASPCLVLKY